MEDEKYMSGAQLRQYLHISTKKMKYLMDHDYIPHKNTGHATHKYRILFADARKFKHRMDTEPNFLSELKGMFSNRGGQEPHPIKRMSRSDREALRRHLKKEWADVPTELPAKHPPELTRKKPQYIYTLVHKKALRGLTVRAVLYVVKDDLIDLVASIHFPHTDE